VVAESLKNKPPSGRIVRRDRRVRLGDVSPAGRLRLDALVRYLQDVATDDSRDVGLTPGRQWVVRSTRLHVQELPVYEDMVWLATWCGGVGSHYAQRRTSIRGDRAWIDAATLWVQVDEASMRPARVDDRFRELYAEAAQGVTVRARLAHHDPSPQAVAAAAPWPLRFTDFDALAHVNNAIAWVVVEELLAERRGLRPPMWASVEHRAPIERDDVVRLAVTDHEAGVDAWLLNVAGAVLVSAEVRHTSAAGGQPTRT